MELRDMLDVVHFLFEEDARYKSQEEAQAVSAVRTSIYSQLYKTTYKYALSGSGSATADSGEFSDPNELKPYIPPTEFNPESSNPFGSVLDAPIG